MKGISEVYSVLVVDDEPDLLEIISFSLEREGMKVTCAANGREALDYIAEGKFNLIISDIRMPEIDGYQVLNHINELEDRPPVIIVTGSEEFADDCLDAYGISEVLGKPFSREDLLAAVKRTMDNALQT